MAVDNFATLGLPPRTTVVLRPHPCEAAGKYSDWMASRPDLDLVLDPNSEVADSLSQARWVAGLETSVLATALRAGRTVFCTHPPGAPPCELPHRGLIYLRDLTSRRRHG